MSEAKSFMQQLDEWTEATIFMPLLGTHKEGFEDEVEQIRKAIREKVLERNGQTAGSRPARKAPRSYAKAQSR